MLTMDTKDQEPGRQAVLHTRQALRQLRKAWLALWCAVTGDCGAYFRTVDRGYNASTYKFKKDRGPRN